MAIKYKVKAAYLQTPCLIAGSTMVNDLTLTPDRHPNLTMLYCAEGLFVEQLNKGRIHRGIIPLANIRNVVLISDKDEAIVE